MANPLFNILGGVMQNSPMGNFAQMMQQFNQFKSNFQGNPQQKVQELLNSGQMSQEQYNQLQNAARQFISMMPK